MVNDHTHSYAARVLLITFAVLTPFIFPSLLVLITGHSIFDAAPYYVGGDAVARYDYIRSLLEYGHLLGYNGYDFVTADIPSLGSAWGFFWSIPYLLFGSIAGWTLNSPIIANILFLCLANLIFILITGCSNRSVILIIVISCLLYINVDYSISAMSEPSRYASAVILSGMIYRLAVRPVSRWFKYIIIPLFIVYSSSTFILLSAFVIPYCIIVIRNDNRLIKFTLTGLIFVISTLFIKRLNSMFCTPYFEAFNMKQDITAFRDGGLIRGLCTVITTSCHNLMHFTYGAVTSFRYQDGKFTWFAGVCWILILTLSILLVRRKYASEHDRYTMLGMLYILLIITFGYIVLYNDDTSTLIRGINTALCVVVFLATLLDSRKIITLYITLALLWSPLFVRNFVKMCNEDYRFLTDYQIEEIQARRDIAAESIILDTDPSADPWDNTVAIKYGGRQTTFMVPPGAGKVSMHRVDLNEKARYVIIGHQSDKSAACISDHIANGHTVTAKTEDFTILKRNDD